MADVNTTFANQQEYLNSVSLAELKTEADFTEVDAELLNQIASMSEAFEEAPGLWECKDTVTIKELYEYALDRKKEGLAILEESDLQLLEQLSQNLRYQNLRVGGFQKMNEFEKTLNSSSDLIYTICDAVTIYLDDGTMIPCFAGTGMYWYSWIEDGVLKTGLMGADLAAAEYVRKILEKNPERKIIISGYSKGGNLAAYAGVALEKEYGDQILRVYNMDGPSFYAVKDSMPEFYQYYVELLKSGKLLTYSPSDSMVGSLMLDPELSQYVKYMESSYWLFFLNHDYHNWTFSMDENGNPHFASGKRSETSKVFSEFLWNAIKQVDDEIWMNFLGVLTQICLDSGMDRTDELPGKLQQFLNINNLSEEIRMVTSYLRELSPEQFDSLKSVLKALTEPEQFENVIHVMLQEHANSTIESDVLRENNDVFQKLEGVLKVILMSAQDTGLETILDVVDAMASMLERADIRSIDQFEDWLEQLKKQPVGKQIVTITDLIQGMTDEQIAAVKQLINHSVGSSDHLEVLFSEYMSEEQAEIWIKLTPLFENIVQNVDLEEAVLVVGAIGRYLELKDCKSTQDIKALFVTQDGKVSVWNTLNELFGLWATMSPEEKEAMTSILEKTLNADNLAVIVNGMLENESGKFEFTKMTMKKLLESKNLDIQLFFDKTIELIVTTLEIGSYIKSGWDQIQNWFKNLTSGKLKFMSADEFSKTIWNSITKGAQAIYQATVAKVVSISNRFAEILIGKQWKKLEPLQFVQTSFLAKMQDITFSTCNTVRANACRVSVSGEIFYDISQMERLKFNIGQWENNVRSVQNSIAYLEYLIRNTGEDETKSQNLTRIQNANSAAKYAISELSGVDQRLADAMQKLNRMEAQLDAIVES